MKFIGIIPARYASKRLPGKPLINISGKPMIQRVYERASKVLDTVFVATDDERIEKAVLNFQGKVIMTSKNHKTGTDRCAEAIDKIHQSLNKKFDVIINIQGDEAFIHTEQIKKIMECFHSQSTQIATLIKPIKNSEEIFNPNKVKVVINNNKEAIYFSRSPIPCIRNAEKEDLPGGICGTSIPQGWIKQHQFYEHIGLYAYKYDTLKKITKLPQSTLELAESLEQLRWIENGYKIKVEITEYESISIDTEGDLKKINNFV